jgi:hypothetical protein
MLLLRTTGGASGIGRSISRNGLARVKPLVQCDGMANKFVPYGSKMKKGEKPAGRDDKSKFGGPRSGKKSKMRR